MRLIDGDALSKETGKLWEEMPDGEELSKELMKAINRAPTVDAVPVVRCKDCKHFFAPCDSKHGSCDKLGHGCSAEEYCSDGERKEE